MALSNKGLNTQLQFLKNVKMCKKCDPTEEKQVLQTCSILQYLLLQLEELLSHITRCEMSFFPLLQKKKSTPYLLLESHCFCLCSLLPSECCYFGFPTSSMFRSVCPVFPVALKLSSKHSFWLFSTRGFHSLTLVLNLGTTWLAESLFHLLRGFPKTHVSKVLPWLSSFASLFLSPARGAALCHLLLFLDALDLLSVRPHVKNL